MDVCFTGPAFDHDGNAVLREDLVAAARRKGLTVKSSVTSTVKLLVASRADTVKAQKAAAAGVDVISYPVFIELLGEKVERQAKPDPWVDTHPDEPGVTVL